MEVFCYKQWGVVITPKGKGYTILCLSPQGELITDWQEYPSIDAAKAAARHIADEDEQIDISPTFLLIYYDPRHFFAQSRHSLALELSIEGCVCEVVLALSVMVCLYSQWIRWH
jgi:hypothetical protein